ncbi:MAG: molybdopterin-dependent oxidoreductase [Myxococcales bacterium]|nr:molybdopterin-dependent oxidoreductase [Myxococcales bacterium]
MSTTQRIADTLARLLGLPESSTARMPRPTEPTNVGGESMPTYGVDDARQVQMLQVDHPDGRMSRYPPPDRWDDWVEWESTAWPRKVARRYTLVPTICFNCESGCGLLAYVDKTTFEIRKLEGNPVHPGSRGRNCAKGPATHNQIYDPERILYPLKRVGKRGEGKWKQVTWEEALDDISAKMRESRKKRRDGIMYHVGRPGEDHYANRCIQAWGVDGHNSHTNVCSASSRTGYYLWAGFDRPSPDYAHAQTILLISSHLETGHYFNPHAQRIMEAKKKGATLITMDPRLSNTASKSDVWLPTWPGSEAWVLLAIANHLLQTDAWNRTFVRDWVDWRGFCRLAPEALSDEAVLSCLSEGEATFEQFEAALKTLYAPFTFERAAAEAQVPVERIRAAAEAVARSGTRLSTHNWRSASIGNRGGWQIVRALFLLNVLTGSIGTKGGTSGNSWNKFVPKPFAQPPAVDTWNELQLPLEWPFAHFEMSFLLPHLMEEGRGTVDVYFTRVYNPLWTNPDGFMWLDKLQDESLFGLHVALTPTWNETAWFADYVLPMGHSAERHDLMSQETHAGQWIGFRQPVRRVAMERAGKTVTHTWEANPGEVWEEAEFWVELSWRMDPDGSMGIRKWFESPVRPGEPISQDEYWSWIFDNSVPGLPEAAAAEELSPLAYMRKYGAFEVSRDRYTPYLAEVQGQADEQGRVHADGKVVGVVVDGTARVGFNTPTRKLELLSETLLSWGWDSQEHVVPWPLKSHVHPDHIDRDAGAMLLLPNFRLPTLIHTRSANAKWLYEISHDNPAWLNPVDAKRLGVSTGDLVRIETETGWFVDRVWVTEGITPGVVAISHHLGRWRLSETAGVNRFGSSLASLDGAGSERSLQVEHGAAAYDSADPDTARVWWNHVGVHQNLAHGVHPDPVSGAHCWLQRAIDVRRATPEERYGEVHVDLDKSMAVYREWKALTRSAAEHSPDGTRRPRWLKRPLKPTVAAYQLPPADAKTDA